MDEEKERCGGKYVGEMEMGTYLEEGTRATAEFGLARQFAQLRLRPCFLCT